jgi:hypothetical protein
MARVPELGPRIGAAPLPGGPPIPTIPVAAFGGGPEVGRALAQAARPLRDVAEFARQEEQKAMRREVAEFQTRAVEESARIRTEWDKLRGPEALDAVAPGVAQFDAVEEELAQDARDPRLRRALNQIWRRHRAPLLAHGERQGTQKMDVFNEERYQAGQSGIFSLAMNSLDDPVEIERLIGDSTSLTIDHFRDTGRPTEAAEKEIRARSSKMLRATISEMMHKGRDIEAEEYFNANKQRLTPEDAQIVGAAVEESSLRGEKFRRVDPIMEQVKAEEITVAQARDEVRKETNPRIREVTIAHLNRRVVEWRNEQRLEAGANYEEAAAIVEREWQLARDKPGPAGALDPQTLAAIRGIPAEFLPEDIRGFIGPLPPEEAPGVAMEMIPPDLWAKLDTGQRDRIRRRMSIPVHNDDRRFKNFEDKYLTNPVSIGLMTRDEYDKFWVYFDQVHRSKADTMRRNALELARDAANPEERRKFSSIRSNKQIATGIMVENNLIPQDNLGPQHLFRLNRFVPRVEDAWATAEQNLPKGKFLTNKEKDVIARDVLNDMYREADALPLGWVAPNPFDRLKNQQLYRVKYFGLKPSDLPGAVVESVPDIPAPTLDKLRQDAFGFGNPNPTPAQLVAAYNAYLRNDATSPDKYRAALMSPEEFVPRAGFRLRSTADLLDPFGTGIGIRR